MHVPPLRPRWRRPARTTIATLLSATLLGAALQGCGGGGGSSTSSNCTVIDPTRPSSLPGCPTTPVTPPVTPPVTTPSMSVLLRDAAGAATTAVTPQASGTLSATIKNSAGAVVPGVVVSFVTTDKSGGFIPASGTALSDANGVASITLPSGTQSGAFTATASASVGGSALSASFNYSVTLPVLTLSSTSISPATLAAGGTAGLSVTVLNGSSVFTPLQTVTFSSPCASAGKAKISSPVTSVNGVASTSYTDLGCGSSDLITASITYNGNTATSTGALAVTQASAGQLAFVSALPQNIALRGTGGAGRQESSTVSFKVLDRNGNPVSGQQVNFTLNTTLGGLTLNPASATTGANGVVSTAVAAGTVNTPVRVTATLPGSTLSTLSDQLVVSTGVPEQNSFTLSSSIYNVEGGSFSGCAAPTGAVITARLADHFHNPAPDGTAVSFTAEGGSIDASCLTGLVNTTLTDGTVITQKGVPGECSVRFCAGNPRQTDGRITVLAYALGEESFVDSNGNNLFDSGEPYVDLGEPFRNDRAVSDANAHGKDDVWKTGNASRVAGEQYIDSNGNGSWNNTGDGQYNGVLKAATAVNTTPANTVHIREALVQVLSNSTAAVTLMDGPIALSHCVDNTAFTNVTQTYHFAIRDNNPTVFAGNKAGVNGLTADLAGNILPAGSNIVISTSNGTVLGNAIFTVANTNSPDAANWIYTVQMASDASQSPPGGICSNTLTSGTLTVTVTTPNGVVTRQSFTVTD